RRRFADGRKFGGAHGRRMKGMAQLQSEVPHPLIHDLPELLASRGVRAPAIRVLLAVFIGQHDLKRAAMQIEVQYVLWRKRLLWQSGDKQFIDCPVTLDTNGWFGRGSRMGRDNDPHEWSPLRQREIRTVVQTAGRPTYRMPVLLIWRVRQTRSHRVS